MKRVFDIVRVLSGIALILAMPAVVYGGAMLVGRGGLTLAVLAFPLMALGFSRVVAPWKLLCVNCSGKVDKQGRSAPFGLASLSAALQLAAQPEPMHFAHFLASAPLPDVTLTPFATLSAKRCGCGDAAYLTLWTVDRVTATLCAAKKELVEFGAEISPQQFELLAQHGEGRWEATERTLGFKDPYPPRS
jgi:hypothetical protein